MFKKKRFILFLIIIALLVSFNVSGLSASFEKEYTGTVSYDSSIYTQKSEEELNVSKICITINKCVKEILLYENIIQRVYEPVKSIYTDSKGNFSIKLDPNECYVISVDTEKLDKKYAVKNNNCAIINGEIMNTLDFCLIETQEEPKESSVSETIQKLDMDSLSKIDYSYKKGFIDYDTKIKYYAYLYLDDERLPEYYKSNKPSEFGTEFFTEIKLYNDLKKEKNDIVELVDEILTIKSDGRPISWNGVLETDHFNIHYINVPGQHCLLQTEDNNSNDHPDIVDDIGDYFEDVYDETCDTREFREPLSPNQDGTYDVYIFDLASGTGCTCSVSSPVTYSPVTYKCEFEIDIVRTGEYQTDELQGTIAHEFFHGVQWAYNYSPLNVWWMEATAVYWSNEIYDNSPNYYIYTDNFLDYCFLGLSAENYNHHYGACLFAMHLSEDFGGWQRIQQTWEKLGGVGSTYTDDPYEAIDYVLNEHTSDDLASCFIDFTKKNYICDTFYEDYDDDWDENRAYVFQKTSYPAYFDYFVYDTACVYSEFIPTSTLVNKTLTVTFDGENNVDFGLYLILKLSVSDYVLPVIGYPNGTTNLYTFTLTNGFGATWNEVGLAVSNPDWNSYDIIDYEFTATET